MCIFVIPIFQNVALFFLWSSHLELVLYKKALFSEALIQRLLFFVLNQFEVIRWNIIYFINADADNGAGVKAEGRQRGEGGKGGNFEDCG